MEWEKLLSVSRFGGEEKYPYKEERYPVTEFEKDYEKIITSASFRRLQDKTQVFPLDKSDFVRTRLTHSMETATIAKRLTGMIVKNINLYQNADPHKLSIEKAAELEDIMMCAGLLHDLGNPPFGHFGEVAIGEWFAKHLNDDKLCFRGKPVKEYLKEQMKKDLVHFEGNAQTIRILTKLHSLDSINGMNLTKAVLNTLIKYPSSSTEFDEDSEDIKYHKLGYFYAEQKEFEAITDETGTRSIAGEVSRHPLTFILEAADDIAYATADLEDAYKKKLFTLDELEDVFDESLKERAKEMSLAQSEKSQKLLQDLRDLRKSCENETVAFGKWVEEARHWFIYSAAYGFTQNYGKIMEGSYKDDIFKETFHEISLKIMKKDIMRKFVYNDATIVKLELSAQTILQTLLDKFVPAVLEFDEEGVKQSKSDLRLTSLISENYKESYRKHKTGVCAEDLYLRLLLVTDYVSGMTDTYAKDLYQALQGIY